MTVRPENYGDQYPSDQGDTAPASPVAGFQERDYRVRGHKSKGIRVRPPVAGVPDMRAENEQREPRPVYHGVVVNRIDEHKYTILRQDGKRGIGISRSTDEVYDHLPPGEPVILVAASEPNQWAIIGAPRRKEMASMRLTNSVVIETDMAEKKIAFDVLAQETGKEYEQLEMSAGGVKVKPGETGQYELSVMIHVEYKDPQNTGMYASASCTPASFSSVPRPFAESPGVVPSTLNFWPSSGFRMYWRAGNCIATVALHVNKPWMIPNSPGNSNGGFVEWSDGPLIGRFIDVGATAIQGWLRVRSIGSAPLGITNGDGGNGLLVKFPPSSPGTFGQSFSGQHFYVRGCNGQGVRLDFTEAGSTGTITILQPAPEYASANAVTITVDKGIITSAPGTAKESNLGASFQQQSRQIYIPSDGAQNCTTQLSGV